MKRVTLIALAVLLAGFIVTQPAWAQMPGQLPPCPADSQQLWPVPVGYSPALLGLCDMTPPQQAQTWSLYYDPSAPCGAGLAHDQTVFAADPRRVQIIPSGTYAFPSGLARLQFYIHAMTGSGPANGGTVRIYSYDSFGNETGFIGFNFNEGERQTTPDGVYFLVSGNLALIQFDQGGWFEVELPTRYFLYGTTIISSLAITDSGAVSPPPCELDWQTPTPTATPNAAFTPTPITATATLTPTVTATGTATPTGTLTTTPTPANTSTPWPTSAGGTPAPTGTPRVFVTSAPDNTPTRIAIPTMAGITLPTLSAPDPAAWPTLAFAGTPQASRTPDATIEAYYIARDDELAEVLIVATRWHTMTAYNLTIVDPQSSVVISRPVDIADHIVSDISAPISRVKGLSIYMPNIWPYLWVIFLMLLWLMFNIVIKFAIGSLTGFISFVGNNIWLILIGFLLAIILWVGLVAYVTWF
jgi:hypothetical protein